MTNIYEEKEALAVAQAEGKPVQSVDVGELRFPKLSAVDAVYKAEDYEAPQFPVNYTLEELCMQIITQITILLYIMIPHHQTRVHFISVFQTLGRTEICIRFQKIGKNIIS